MTQLFLVLSSASAFRTKMNFDSIFIYAYKAAKPTAIAPPQLGGGKREKERRLTISRIRLQQTIVVHLIHVHQWCT